MSKENEIPAQAGNVIMLDAPKPTKLDSDLASKMAGALAELRQLQSRKIKTPNDEAIQQGLEQFLTAELQRHANELLGCYFVIRNEYEPLVNVLAAVFGRVGFIQNQQAQARAAAQQASKDEPGQ